MVTMSSVVKTQNLVVNPNHGPLSWTLNNSNLLWKKLILGWLLGPKRIICKKKLAKQNCSVKCQNYRVDWPSNKQLFNPCQHAKIIQSICSIHQIICEMRYTWLKSPIIYKASPIFHLTNPITITVTFNLPKLVSAYKKSVHLINSCLRYSRFWSLKT